MGREAVLLALTLLGCDRAPAKEPAAASPVSEPAPGLTKVVVPTEAAPIVAPPTPEESAPAAAPADRGARAGSTTAAPRPVKPAPAPASKGAPPAPLPAVPPPAPLAPPSGPPVPKTLVDEKLYRVELATLAPCKAAVSCEAKLIVHALGGYKVNAEYPTKFVAKPSASVTVNGTGTFSVAGKTPGTMIVSFRADAAGTASIAGKLKLSVCTDEVCEIAAIDLAFEVPVTAP